MVHSSVQDSVRSALVSLYHQSLKEPSLSLLHVLSTTKGCGLFLFIDNTMEKRVLDRETADLFLDILRHINSYSEVLSSAVSKLTTNEQHFRSFVVKQLTCAQQIVATSNSILSPVYTSARRLVESVASYKNQREHLTHLEECWRDFLLHFYRYKLYRCVMTRA